MELGLWATFTWPCVPFALWGELRLKEAQKGPSQSSKDGLPPILSNTWSRGSWGSFLGRCPSGQVGQEDKPTPVASGPPLGSWDQVGVGMVWRW